jgi:hypothetical protein
MRASDPPTGDPSSRPPAVTVRVADDRDLALADRICDEMKAAAKVRGTGIAKRSPDYIREKMTDGKAVVALDAADLAGFCYIETWEHGRYVANSGLVVVSTYRHMGLARRIKRRAFELSRERYPDAKLFGITTSLAVMKINADLGYRPVTFSELTRDDVFWKGCQSCPNVDILHRTNHAHCLCTGMLHDPGASRSSDEDKKPQ